MVVQKNTKNKKVFYFKKGTSTTGLLDELITKGDRYSVPRGIINFLNSINRRQLPSYLYRTMHNTLDVSFLRRQFQNEWTSVD